jgi:hypothetical protein
MADSPPPDLDNCFDCPRATSPARSPTSPGHGWPRNLPSQHLQARTAPSVLATSTPASSRPSATCTRPWPATPDDLADLPADMDSASVPVGLTGWRRDDPEVAASPDSAGVMLQVASPLVGLPRCRRVSRFPGDRRVGADARRPPARAGLEEEWRNCNETQGSTDYRPLLRRGPPPDECVRAKVARTSVRCEQLVEQLGGRLDRQADVFARTPDGRTPPAGHSPQAVHRVGAPARARLHAVRVRQFMAT